MGGLHVDIVRAIAEMGDQPQLRAGSRDDLGVDLVGDGRHEHVRALNGGDQHLAAEGRVGFVELDIEQLAHARLDTFRQLARDHDAGLFAIHTFEHHFFRPVTEPSCIVNHAVSQHLNRDPVIRTNDLETGRAHRRALLQARRTLGSRNL